MSKHRPNKTEIVSASIAHILGIVSGIFGPLFIFYASNNEYIQNNARRATNWQASLLIFLVISSLFGFVGQYLVALLLVSNVVFSLVASTKAMAGEEWDYPITLAFLSENTPDSDSDSSVERIKKLYKKGEIDYDEMDNHLDRTLQSEDDKRRVRNNNSYELEKN